MRKKEKKGWEKKIDIYTIIFKIKKKIKYHWFLSVSLEEYIVSEGEDIREHDVNSVVPTASVSFLDAATVAASEIFLCLSTDSERESWNVEGLVMKAISPAGMLLSPGETVGWEFDEQVDDDDGDEGEGAVFDRLWLWVGVEDLEWLFGDDCWEWSAEGACWDSIFWKRQKKKKLTLMRTHPKTQGITNLVS